MKRISNKYITSLSNIVLDFYLPNPSSYRKGLEY